MSHITPCGKHCRWAGNLIVADQVFSRFVGFVGWDELVLLKPRALPGTMSSSSQTTTTHALLAQLAEQLTLNQRVVGSSPTGGTPESGRTNPSKPVAPHDLRQTQQEPPSRLNPTASDRIRPPRATRGATRVCAVAPALDDNPGLAAVVEAWPDLPEALKAGILAMVKAAQT